MTDIHISKHHKFTTLAEIAALTPEEFGRMLPDFVQWYTYTSTVNSVMIDGEVAIKGPAFSEGDALREEV